MIAVTAPSELEFASEPGAAPVPALPALRELWLQDVRGAFYDISRAVDRLKRARVALAEIDAAIAAALQGDPTP